MTTDKLDILTCTCTDMHAVRRVVGGNVCVYLQCPICGRGGGAKKKADYDVDALPWWNDHIVAAREEAWKQQAQQRQEEFYNERQSYVDEFHQRYAPYLKTPHWAGIKRRALLRDNFRCQHCHTPVNASNSQAHHIRPWGYETFNRYGYSMLFEVVTLCTDCHAEAEGRLP